MQKVLYKVNNKLELVKHKTETKTKFFLRVLNKRENLFFIHSFLMTNIPFTNANIFTKQTENQYINIDLFFDDVIPLKKLLKKKYFNYDNLERLYITLSNQINTLRHHNYGFPSLHIDDIFFFKGSTNTFCYLNIEQMCRINGDNNLIIEKPIKLHDFSDVLVKQIKSVPNDSIYFSVSYFSLGKIVLKLLSRENYSDNKIIKTKLPTSKSSKASKGTKTAKTSTKELLHKIKNTKLYYAIKRNLTKNVNERYSLII